MSVIRQEVDRQNELLKEASTHIEVLKANYDIAMKCMAELRKRVEQLEMMKMDNGYFEDLLFNVTCSILFFILSFIEAYYSTGSWSNNCNDMGSDGFIHNGCRIVYEWAFAAFLTFILAIFYALSAFFSYRNRHSLHNGNFRSVVYHQNRLDERSKTLFVILESVASEQQKADILSKQGKLEEAEKIYEKLRNSEKLVEIRRIQNHLDEIEHAFENGDYEVAEEMIAGIIEDQKWNGELFKKRAKCAEMAGDFKKAVRNLKQLIKLSPDSTDLMHEVSQISYKIGDFDDSLKMIRECLKLNADHKECFAFYKTIKKLVKGVDSVKLSIESQNWEECLKTAEKTVKSFENAKSALQILSLKCHRESGNNQQTIIDATELLNSAENPFETEILHHRALVFLEESEFDDAIRDLKKMLENDEDNREFKELLRKAENAKVQAGKRDYYKILGVKRNAKKKEIVKAYRQLAQKWHPDNFKSEEEKKKAEKKFIDIAAAKEVLTDKEKREQFDNGIDPLDPGAAQNQQNHGHHGGFPHGFNPFGGNGGNFHFFYN
ncbi:unnamed protein product [Caenorhabditis angaria]|uniref:J domain-containing protein n=1 Tax=Caenorhabditis angaria TaxID=860376 RepID=A0A9P1IA76_9PELO|nr:unnamed protein product [Caenorhabditis angaria]